MSKKVDLPALNWFVHVLTQNIGGADWVPKTPEELTADDKYPYNVVTHPIPDGKDIILENGKYKIECSEEYVRELIFDLARRYHDLEIEHGKLLREQRADFWRPANEVPDGPHSSCRKRRVLVTSPALQYVVSNGVCDGYEENGWYIMIDGKAIRHAVSHWRYLPPGATEPLPYEKIKDEVASLRNAIGRRK